MTVSKNSEDEYKKRISGSQDNKKLSQETQRYNLHILQFTHLKYTTEGSRVAQLVKCPTPGS